MNLLTNDLFKKYNLYGRNKMKSEYSEKLPWVLVKSFNIVTGSVGKETYVSVNENNVKKIDLIKPGRLVSIDLKTSSNHPAIVIHVLSDTEKANLDPESRPTQALRNIYEYDNLKDFFSDSANKIQTNFDDIVNKDKKDSKVGKQALLILKEVYGPDAKFHKGQLEAIESVVNNPQTLVVQKTGWGKSLVYFIATKILRKNGFGTTFIVSPLLSLMNNQKKAAEKFGLRTELINGKNSYNAYDILENMNDYDIIIVTPEQLKRKKLKEQGYNKKDKHLFVVDEVHSVSEMGQGFRPDYQRIFDIIQSENIKFLGTTATAGDRVIKDLNDKLKSSLSIVRGNLARNNLAIQVNKSQSLSERLAWLVKTLKYNKKLNDKKGIIYCLTARECDMLVKILEKNNISAISYHGKKADAEESLKEFENSNTNVLVATDKIGMGYDNFSIDFVIHFQRPKNLTTYYQQIGRAGRSGQDSYAILMHGSEDEEVIEHFISEEHVVPEILQEILNVGKKGFTDKGILNYINDSNEKISQGIKYLSVKKCLYPTRQDDGSYINKSKYNNSFDLNDEKKRQYKLNQIRNKDFEAFSKYLETKKCYMNFIVNEFNGLDSGEICGICSNCLGKMIFNIDVTNDEITSMSNYINNQHGKINPRFYYSSGEKIPNNLLVKDGGILYNYYNSENGQSVKDGKYKYKVFSEELVNSSAKFLKQAIKNYNIDLIVPIPSLGRPELVPTFAKKLADLLGIKYCNAVIKTKKGEEQKKQENSAKREENIRNTIKIDDTNIKGKRILLVDDMVDSRWSFTVIGEGLLKNGASAVYPFALVKTGSDL